MLNFVLQTTTAAHRFYLFSAYNYCEGIYAYAYVICFMHGVQTYKARSFYKHRCIGSCRIQLT